MYLISFAFLSLLTIVTSTSDLYQLFSPSGVSGDSAITGDFNLSDTLVTLIHAYLSFPVFELVLTLYQPVPIFSTSNFTFPVGFSYTCSCIFSLYISSVFAIPFWLSVASAIMLATTPSYFVFRFGNCFPSSFPMYSTKAIPYRLS